MDRFKLTVRKWKEMLRSRKQLEEQLHQEFTQISKSEEEILALWRMMEEANSSRHNQHETCMRAIERKDKALKDWCTLTEKVNRVEKELMQALETRQKIMKEYSEIRARVKELEQQHAVIEHQCESIWELAFCLDEQHEEQQEWRENLRRTRSQSGINKAVHRSLHAKTWKFERNENFSNSEVPLILETRS